MTTTTPTDTPDVAADRVWDRYNGGTDPARYPDHVPVDSLAGQACRFLTAGATIDELEQLEAAVMGDQPGPDATAQQRRDDERVRIMWSQMSTRMAALLARHLNRLGVPTPGVTVDDITAVLDAPRPPCGASTRAGTPCARTTVAPGIPCWQHDHDR